MNIDLTDGAPHKRRACRHITLSGYDLSRVFIHIRDHLPFHFEGSLLASPRIEVMFLYIFLRYFPSLVVFNSIFLYSRLAHFD
jgi:hypothetical protein